MADPTAFLIRAASAEKTQRNLLWGPHSVNWCTAMHEALKGSKFRTYRPEPRNCSLFARAVPTKTPAVRAAMFRMPTPPSMMRPKRGPDTEARARCAQLSAKYGAGEKCHVAALRSVHTIGAVNPTLRNRAPPLEILARPRL